MSVQQYRDEARAELDAAKRDERRREISETNEKSRA